MQKLIHERQAGNDKDPLVPIRQGRLRTSPVLSPVRPNDKPSASPAPEESEDERQYMMLRHSDDENGNGSGGSGGSGSVADNGAAGAGREGDRGRGREGGGGSGGSSRHHVIPKSPDRGSTRAPPPPPRNVSMRGRAVSAPAGARQYPHEQHQGGYQYQQGGYHQGHHYQQGGYECQAPAPLRVGGPPPPPPHGHGGPPPGGPQGGGRGPPQYMRGVSEDAGSLTHRHGVPGPYNPYHSAALSMAPSWGDLDMRQGTFDFGDYPGTDPSQVGNHGGTNVITPAQTVRKTTASAASQAALQGANGPPPPMPPTTHAAPTVPTAAGGGHSPDDVGDQGVGKGYYMYPPSSPIKASPKASPGTSPEETSPEQTSPEGTSPEGSPRFEGEENEVQLVESPRVKQRKTDTDSSPSQTIRKGSFSGGSRSERSNSGSEEELAAEWLPPQSAKRGRRGSAKETIRTPRLGNGMEPAAVHVPPPPPGQQRRSDRNSSAFAAAASATSNASRVRPQFVRQPSHAPGSVSFADTTGEGTPSPRRPPLVVDSSRSNDSSESPGHSLQGGRVQLVGGGIGEGGAPWSLVSRSRSGELDGQHAVSRSRSIESHGSSGHGSTGGEYWDPPRPNRMGMVPPPGRPEMTTRAVSAPSQPAQRHPSQYPPGHPEYGRGMRPPPPQRHQSAPGQPRWDYYGRQGPPDARGPPGPPGDPAEGPPPSPHGRVGGPPGSQGPHHPYPPGSYPPNKPQGYPGYPPRTGSGYPSYPHPPGQYHPSQYPPQPYYPGGPQGGPTGGPSGHRPPQGYPPQDGPPRGPPPMVDLGKDDDDELRSSPSVHPLLKDYNPHCDGMEIRPQFMNVKKQRADEAKQQRMNAAGAAGTPGGMPNGHGQGVQGAPQATPRRRRRRNPSEKAAAAAAMAAAAAAALQERKEKEMAKQRRAEEAAKATAGGTHGNAGENRKGASADGVTTIVAGNTTGVAGSPFSEEELKTLGSGDDEDIPAAKRAAMASAVALRAAAGGSPLDPPKSAKEVTFDIADPPSSPICPPSAGAVLESATLMTENDVLCGRGGGTNSQMGNRRFRALVRDFQPTYLMAKRREKPRMARSVVLIVRNRGGRFLRRDDADGRLYEVGDDKAEAKTSQALREGLDVRATKTAANTLMGTAASASEPGGGARKRKQGGAPTPPGNAPRAGGGRATRDGSGPAGAKREPSARPRPVHAPGYPPHSAPIPLPPGGPPRPGYYPSYPPMYDDPYRRSRYPPHPPPPPDARPSGYGSHPPPPPTAVHYHHHYGPGASGGPHYPPSYGGYPGAGAAPTDGAYPSPPRSSHKTLGRGGGSDARQVAPRGPAEAAFSPPRAEGIRGQQQQQRRPPPPPPDLTPVGSQRKVL